MRSDLVRLAASLLLLGLASVPLDAQVSARVVDTGALADRVFRQFATSAPGCVVGVSQYGSVLLERAYGVADLERGVPLSASSILEAGSVSKQFTAAAVTLLALDGRIRFDDQVQKFFPEIPQYDRPITIRMLLDHTSGLRDWGDMASIGGWPRGSRVHTHAHVLEIIARQQSLNYSPGERYSYTNSGYNLLAMLVERVSGESFADFTRRRLFAPLGMTHTSWRDDHRRVVVGRAQAYRPTGGQVMSWDLDMPFENAHGNGGLLTTVGDLLRWNAALTSRTVGGVHGRTLVDSLTRRGVLTGGDSITYAAGLVVDQFRGTQQIAHSGATAGYRSYLALYPEQGDLSVAVLCNTASNAGQLAHGMVDGLAVGLSDPPPSPRAPSAPAFSLIAPDSLSRFVGEYASLEAEVEVSISLDGDRLVLRRAPADVVRLVQVAADQFSGAGIRFWFKADAAGDSPTLHVGTSRAYDVVFTRVRR